MFVSQEMEENFGIKPGNFAILWFPAPVEVILVRSAMAHAILAIFDCTTACTIVEWTQLVWDPLAIGVIAWCFSITTMMFFGGGGRRRGEGGGGGGGGDDGGFGVGELIGGRERGC